MSRKCPPQRCPVCEDRMIHQSNRGKDESSSAYGQHIHDDYRPMFFWADIDGIIFKRATQIMRKQSGIFVVQSEPEWKEAIVERFGDGKLYELDGESLKQFETGELLTKKPKLAKVRT